MLKCFDLKAVLEMNNSLQFCTHELKNTFAICISFIVYFNESLIFFPSDEITWLVLCEELSEKDFAERLRQGITISLICNKLY